METIYIVDDDAQMRASLSFFLNAAGYLIHVYSNGPDFISEANDLEPGCLLLDVWMPGMDGLEVLTALSTQQARLPVVVMTGHGDIATAVRAMKAGALDFIEKPFDGAVLLGILARAFVSLSEQVQIHDRRVEAMSRIVTLSERERDVLHGLSAGRSNKVVAHELGLSVRTVEMHRASMMERLGVRSLAEALRIAFDGVSYTGAAVKSVTKAS